MSVQLLDSGWPKNSQIVIDLSGTEEQIWDNLKGNTRRLIRRSTEEKHYLHPGDDFWPFYFVRMSSKGIDPPSLEKLKSKPGLLMVERQHDGRVVGGALLRFKKTEAIYDLGANVTQWLIWQMILECKKRNIPKLNLGWSRLHGNTYFFKIHIAASYTETIKRASLFKMIFGFISRYVNVRTYYVYSHRNNR